MSGQLWQQAHTAGRVTGVALMGAAAARPRFIAPAGRPRARLFDPGPPVPAPSLPTSFPRPIMVETPRDAWRTRAMLALGLLVAVCLALAILRPFRGHVLVALHTVPLTLAPPPPVPAPAAPVPAPATPVPLGAAVLPRANTVQVAALRAPPPSIFTPAAPPAAVGLADLPEAAIPRVAVFYVGRAPGAPGAAQAVATRLRAAGIDVVGPLLGGAAPPGVVFAYAEDRPEADRIAALVGLDHTVRPARWRPNLAAAPPGTIRVVVGTGPG